MEKIAVTTEQGLNTLFNPFARDEQLVPLKNSDRHKRAMMHALGLSVGYGSLLALASKMRDKATASDSDKYKEKLDAYSQARFPTAYGLPEGLEPYEEKEAKDNPAHLALAFAAAITGGYLGYKGSAKESERQYKADVDQQLSDLDAETDALVQQEYDRTRDLSKFASDLDKEALDVLNAGSQTYLLYAAVAAALAYKGAKDITDDSDEGRKKLDAIKDVAKQRAKVSRAPVMMAGSLGSRLPGSLQAGPSNKELRRIGVQHLGDARGEVKEDPFSGILA